MTLLTVVGARPQFIKAAAVPRRLRHVRFHRTRKVLVHTGQHHDANMSQAFFDELDIPAPAYNLWIPPGTHGRMKGRMLEALEAVSEAERPDFWNSWPGARSHDAAGCVAGPARPRQPGDLRAAPFVRHGPPLASSGSSDRVRRPADPAPSSCRQGRDG
jgi:UDP-N-acetylglucosamine 2-epimerase